MRIAPGVCFGSLSSFSATFSAAVVVHVRYFVAISHLLYYSAYPFECVFFFALSPNALLLIVFHGCCFLASLPPWLSGNILRFVFPPVSSQYSLCFCTSFLVYPNKSALFYNFSCSYLFYFHHVFHRQYSFSGRFHLDLYSHLSAQMINGNSCPSPLSQSHLNPHTVRHNCQE